MLRLACRFCAATDIRSEEHTSELQSQSNLVCRLLLEKKKDSQPLLFLPRYAVASQPLHAQCYPSRCEPTLPLGGSPSGPHAPPTPLPTRRAPSPLRSR